MESNNNTESKENNIDETNTTDETNNESTFTFAKEIPVSQSVNNAFGGGLKFCSAPTTHAGAFGSMPTTHAGAFGSMPTTHAGAFGSMPTTHAGAFGSSVPTTKAFSFSGGATTFGVKPSEQPASFGTNSVPVTTAPVNSQNTSGASMAGASMAGASGAFGFGPAQQMQQRINPGGCCSTHPPNIQRHPETGQPIPKPTQPVFGFGCNQMPVNNLHNSRDKLIDELYSELRRLQTQVNESNKLIGNMYELLRKLN